MFDAVFLMCSAVHGAEPGNDGRRVALTTQIVEGNLQNNVEDTRATAIIAFVGKA